MLSKIGVGAPHHEIVLQDSEVIRGESLQGLLRIEGGKSSQDIDHLDIALQTRYFNPLDPIRSNKETLRQYRIHERFRLGAGEVREIPFDLVIPMLTPVSLELGQVWLRTGMDVSWVIHAHDDNPIKILPDLATRHLLENLLALGFEHSAKSGCCQALDSERDLPFTQVFSLRPKERGSRRLSQQVQGLDLLVRANSFDAEIQIEVNRQDQALAGWLPEGVQQEGRQLRFRLRHNQLFPAKELAERINQVVKLQQAA